MCDKKLLFAIAFVSAGVLPAITNGQEVSGRGSPNVEVKRIYEQMAALRGKEVYSKACEACHGSLGDGNGPAARYLDPRPRDFTSGMYKFRSTPSGELPTDEDMFRTISRGISKTMMPSWEKQLTEQERWDVVAYIKSFTDDFEQYGPGEPIQTGEPPEPTPERINEGKSVYILLECWACHGVKGKGDGKSSGSLTDGWGHKIKPFDFTVGNYKAGNDPKSVYKTFITGLNGTPMPSYAATFWFGSDSFDDFSNYNSAFSAHEVAALKAYLDSQPTEGKIAKMTETELKELADRRSWSLVHYVKSLSKRTGLFYRMFAEGSELTK